MTLRNADPRQLAALVAVVESGTFTAAESYHQDYYQRNPIRYKYYRSGCGRDKRLEALWGSEAGGGMGAGMATPQSE